jgi:hypothetical protein
MKRDLGLRQNPQLNEKIAKLLFSTNPDLAVPEVGSRGNYLARPASALEAATPALVPGAAATALTPSPLTIDIYKRPEQPQSPLASPLQ